MGTVKKAKSPKMPKLANMSKRDIKKKKKEEALKNKKLDRALGTAAVMLCVVSSVLDVVIDRKKTN